MLTSVAGCCCWLLLLVSAADSCCWLFLLVAANIAFAGCCCWLLLLIAAVGGRKVFEHFRDIGDLRRRQICRRKCLYFRVVDDLRLRQFCRRKSLWMFSGCWWKVFEYFRVVDEKSLNISRRLMGGKWKRFSPPGSRVVDGRKWMNKNGCALGIYTRMAADSVSFGESQ